MYKQLLYTFPFLFSTLSAEALKAKIETPHAILINADTGQILYEKNSRESIYPASTTKVAMALYILKQSGLDLEAKVAASSEALKRTTEADKKNAGYALPPYWLENDGTMIYLRHKEALSVKELLQGMLIASGNDAANVLGEYIGGSIPAFVAGVNQMAKELGCVSTHFSNPHGLFHPDHVTCSYDLALFAKEAIKYPLFCEIVGSERFMKPQAKGAPPTEFKQNNHLVRKESKFYYPHAFGIKTGYVKMAGHNLVAGSDNGERRLILVLNKSPSMSKRNQEAILLFDAAFAEKKARRLLFKREETLFRKEIEKAKSPLEALFREDLYLEYYPSEEQPIHSKIIWHPLTLPIAQGDLVGEMELRGENGRVLLLEPLFAKENIEKVWEMSIGLLLLIIIIIISTILFTLLKRKRAYNLQL